MQPPPLALLSASLVLATSSGSPMQAPRSPGQRQCVRQSQPSAIIRRLTEAFPGQKSASALFRSRSIQSKSLERSRTRLLSSLEMPEISMDFDDGFVLKDLSMPPTIEELSNENLLRIIMLESTDQETNELVWKCLGYRFQKEDGTWDNSLVFPKWKEKYPQPPDVIGVRRIYTKEVDEPVLRANQALVRSIPMDYKNGIREHLFGLNGFFGLKMEGLTPNKTRRAQCANWLLYFREALMGKSIGQLKQEREQKRGDNAEAETQDIDVSGDANLEARRAGNSIRVAQAPSSTTE